MIILVFVIAALTISLIFVKLVEKKVGEENGKNNIYKTFRKKRGKMRNTYYIINKDENVCYDLKETIADFESKCEEEKIVMDNAKMVRVKDYIPDIEIELKYAEEDNFTHKVIYDFADAYLRLGTVVKLKKVHENLKKQGFKLKIWDAFRPIEAQFKLWEVYPDDTFVANPEKGYSDHSRGNTVDVTLTTADGEYVRMPSGFDDFSENAKRDYMGGSEEGKANNSILEQSMINQGFVPYINEWWHYTDEDEYPVEKIFDAK